MRRISQLDAAYEYIRDKFARGELEPGQKLSRRILAEEIGCSPALVQHALGQLEKAGLVECRPQSGTYVRKLTADEFANLCDLRELIEPYAAARAADRITRQQLKVLEKSSNRYRYWQERALLCDTPLEQWKMYSSMVDEEQVFHGTILTAACNDMLANLIHSLHLLSQVTHNFVTWSLKSNEDVPLEHDQIVDALRMHDSGLARQRMLEHIRNGRNWVEQRLRENSQVASREPGGVHAKTAGNESGD